MEKYQSYKHSGIEWIGEIPENWKISKFKFLTTKEVQYGVNSSSENYIDTGIRFIRTTDILDSGELIDKGVYVEESTIPERQITELFDFLISRSGTLGRTYLHLNSEKYTYGGYLVRFNFGSEPISKFIDYYCKSTSFSSWITLNTIVSTIGNVNGQKYSNMEVPLPPSNSIIKIVQFLDEKTELLDKLISTKERKITLLKEQRTSIINQVVTKGLNPNVKMKNSGVEWIGEIPEGWKVGRLGYFSNVFRGSGYQYLNQVDEDFEGRKERVVRISDISEFNPIWFEYLEQFENYRIKKDEILMGGTGHYFGKSIYVTDEMEGLIHSYNIIRIVVKNLNTKYIQYYISSNMIREQMDMSVLGSGQPFIDLQGLKDLIILIPENNEQLQIVEYLDSKTKEIDDLVHLEQKKIDLLKEYRQSLISEVVTGKIKVTN